MNFSAILDQCFPLAPKSLAIVERIKIAWKFGLENVNLFQANFFYPPENRKSLVFRRDENEALAWNGLQLEIPK